MRKIIREIYIFLFLLFFLFAISAEAQDQDSLLRKINEIDVSLDSPPDSVENLYLNTVSFQSFYDLLSPVGEWIQISKEEVDEELGNVNGQGFALDAADDELLFIWRPSGVETGWRPYSDGKWVYTERGWVWFSNEQWGPAVYHYGRWWHSPKFGWVWMPGYVWAPAWVQWRVAENHVGWCPLSPRAKWRISAGITELNYKYQSRDEDWVFVNKSGFADDIGRNNILAAGENSKIIKNSNPILNVKTENDAIVHSGPDSKDIERSSGKLVVQRSLRFSSDRNKTGISGNEITLFRGPVKKYASVKEKMNTAKEKPVKFRKTKKAKKILKKKIERRIRIRRHR